MRNCEWTRTLAVLVAGIAVTCFGVEPQTNTSTSTGEPSIKWVGQPAPVVSVAEFERKMHEQAPRLITPGENGGSRAATASKSEESPSRPNQAKLALSPSPLRTRAAQATSPAPSPTPRAELKPPQSAPAKVVHRGAPVANVRKPVVVERRKPVLLPKPTIPAYRRGPEVSPVPHDREIQAAASKLVDGHREVIDAGRALIQSRTPARGQDSASSGPALSNYYGDVTINYVVTPEAGGGSVATESGLRAYTRLAQHATVLPTPDGALPLSTGGQVPETIVPMQENGLAVQSYGPMEPVQVCDGGCCANPVYCHRLGIFADALYFRPGNVDVTYAREQFGCDPATASPAGGVGRVAPKDQLGFRIGLTMPLSESSSLVGTYTWWQADSVSSLIAGNGAVIASNVTHPSTANCGSNSNRADAFYDLDMQMVELDYRRLVWGDCDWAVNYNVGLRYGHLSQDFGASQLAGAAAGLTNVSSEINFDGMGIGLGIDGLRRSPHSGLFLYGRGESHFMGGDFDARYRQATQFGGGIDIASSASEFRLVTVLETELGIGWQNASGCLRVMAGYQASAWFNTLLMKDYLNTIRTSEPDPNANDTMSLSGLVFRAEVRH